MIKPTFEKVERIIQCAQLYGPGKSCRVKTKEAQSMLDDIQLHASGYAEPGYDDPESGIIATGNWNTITRWDKAAQKLKTLDEAPAQLAKLFEKWGVAIEWSDEWTACDDCGKLVRTSPDGYGWKRSYVDHEDGTQCAECAAKDAAGYLESIEGNDRTCVTLNNIDPSDHGYILLEEDFENGFHPGQDADPTVIGKSLRDLGVTRYLFKLDDVGQFDVSFSVWVHQEELESLDMEAWQGMPVNGPSVSQGLERALRAAANLTVLPVNPITVIRCNVTDGTATARTITPEDFVKGHAFD